MALQRYWIPEVSLADRLRGLTSVFQRTWRTEPRLLLCPNVPKPLHGVAPREVLGAKWWDAERQAAYRSASYHCLACGVWKHEAAGRRWLEGHELYHVDYLLGRVVYVCAVPLCHFCHNYIHSGRLQALLDRGEIHHAKYAAIIRHGDGVLARAGLRRWVRGESVDGPRIAPWGAWRLVVNGVEYPPKYKTFDQWQKAFSVNDD